jgi:hypothetical protein
MSGNFATNGEFHAGSFTCRKFATWYRRLYFPSEERHAEDFFFALKNPTASARFEPVNLGYQRPACYSLTPEAANFVLGYLDVTSLAQTFSPRRILYNFISCYCGITSV